MSHTQSELESLKIVTLEDTQKRMEDILDEGGLKYHGN